MVQDSAAAFSEAEQSFREAQELLQSSAVKSQALPGDDSSLGGVCNNLGMVLEKQARFDDAVDSYRLAVEHQKSACRSSPPTVRYRELLARHYYNYGRVLRRLARYPEALEIARARWELCHGDAQRLASVADELARIAQEVRQLPADRAATDGLAPQAESLAIGALKEAAGLGSDPAQVIRKSEALMALKDNSEIEVWLSGAVNTNPKRERGNTP